MLHIPNIEEINNLLLRTPDLVKLYEDRDPDFVKAIGNWLKDVEITLHKNRLTFVAEISGMRTSLLSTERGESNKDVNLKRYLSRRKVMENIASQLITSAVNSIQKGISQDIARIRNAEARIYELVIISRQMGLIQTEPLVVPNITALKKIWEDLKVDNGVEGKKAVIERVIAVQTMVGKIDSLILLERVLSIN